MTGRFREIDRLVVVAGVSCTGKTTLLRQIKGKAPPEMPAPFAALDLPAFEMVNAIDIDQRHSLPRNCLLHYDLFRPMTFHDALSFEVDPALDLMRRAKYRAVLTLWEDPGTLLSRSLTRRRRLWRKVARPSSLLWPGRNLDAYRRARTRRERMDPWLRDPERLWSIYLRWFAFLEEAQVEVHRCARISSGVVDAMPFERGPAQPFWSTPPSRQRAG